LILFKKPADIKWYIAKGQHSGITVGFVPTMGALHRGHLSLIEKAKRDNELVVCSIFVNPAQFNDPLDLEKYPRPVEEDIMLLSEAGCEVLFLPEVSDIYPNGPHKLKDYNLGHLETFLEGASRPGHFKGVVNVVDRLLEIVVPNKLYLGQKDFQQYAIIQKLVDELKFGLTLHRIETLREEDGLAMSSRNLRLDGEQRIKATIFYKSLLKAKKAIDEGQSILIAKRIVSDEFEKQNVKLEYFEIADSKNLNLLESVKDTQNPPVMCIAGYVGDVRLIDNMFLN